MKSLKGEPDNGHVILKTTISKVIITWMSCLENDDNNDASIKVRICTITLFIRKLLVVDLWYDIDMFRLWNVFYEFLNEWWFHRNV